MTRKTLVSVFLILFIASMAAAQKLYPISGGTGTQPDPEDHKRILLIAENSDIRITLGRTEKYPPRNGLMALYLKVENKSDKPLAIDPSKFMYVDDEGRAYSGLLPKDAIEKIFAATAGKRSALGIALSGPLAGPAMNQAAERQVSEQINREALQAGEIPPHTFKDGGVYLEAPKKKQTTIKMTLTGLWPDPFLFSTEKPKEK